MTEKENANKIRTALWLYPDTMKSMDDILHSDNCKSRSEFIEKALDFYIGYLSTQESTTFLSDVLVGAVQGTIQNTENRIANNLFRLSVEMSMMMNLIAAGLEIEDEQLLKLRGRCVREIKKSKGRVTLEDAVAYQRE